MTLQFTSEEMDRDIILKTDYIRVMKKVETNGEYYIHTHRYTEKGVLLYNTVNTKKIQVTKKCYDQIEKGRTYRWSRF